MKVSSSLTSLLLRTESSHVICIKRRGFHSSSQIASIKPILPVLLWTPPSDLHFSCLKERNSVSVWVSVCVCVNRKGEMEDMQPDKQRMKQDEPSDIPSVVLKLNRLKTLTHDSCVFFFSIFSRRVPGKRRKRSKRVKAATRASISPNANTTASPAER